MSPFLQFRVWLRRSPARERALAAAMGTVLLTLVCLALVPTGGGARLATAPGGVPAGEAGSAAISGAAQGPGKSSGSGAVTGSAGIAPSAGTGAAGAPGGATSGSAQGTPVSVQGGPAAGAAAGLPVASPGGAPAGGGAPGASGTSCGAAGATDQGVTARQINLDVDVADLAGQAGNSLAGIPSAQDEEAMFGAAIAAVNAQGGVRCRQLVPKYYTANALDPSSLQALCLQIVADHPFALLDDGLASPNGPTTPRDCPPSNHIPEFGSLGMSEAELQQYAPYIFSDTSSAEEMVNDWILGASRLGWFSGPGRVGLLEQDCISDINGLVMADLASVGVRSSRVETFDFGCPNEIPLPSQVEEAVLQFKSAGVTNVLDDGGVYESYFSKDAAQQDYKPKYSVADQASIALWDNPDFGPDPSNFSGALAVTASQYGAENTPGTVFNQQTAQCDKAMAAKGLPPAEHSPDGFAGVACALVTMFVTAAANSSSLLRADLAAGLARAGTLVLPFPAGPANVADHSGLHGGGYWRPDTWVTACSCFRVADPTFAPSFPLPSR